MQFGAKCLLVPSLGQSFNSLEEFLMKPSTHSRLFSQMFMEQFVVNQVKPPRIVDLFDVK